MKLSIVFFLVATLPAFAAVIGQTVTLSEKNIKLEKVFSEIKKQTGYNFLYKDALLNKSKKITVSANKMPLTEVLDRIFSNQLLTYSILNNTIVVKEDKNKKNRPPDPIKIVGSVRDNSGNPIKGASIAVKGQTLGTVTDDNGRFGITVDENAELEISAVGYVTQTVKINGDTTIDVKLLSGENKMDEIVVVGYGTQKKSDVTGSVASVPKDRLEKLPVNNVLQAIAGSVAGVNIASGSNQPGNTPSFYVRGLKSITASNEPLIVLDGSIFDGSYNDINPDDVASIDILKDNSAAAIYGSRGANGVMLITTKRGATGKPTIAISSWAGPEYVPNVFEPMSPEKYLQKYADWAKQSGNPDAAPLPTIPEQENYAAGKTVNWMDEVLQTGLSQSHNLSISGGTPDVKYYVSGNYFKQEGVLRGYQYNRFSLRANIDAKITSWLNSGVNLFWANHNNDGGSASLYLASTLSPYGTLYDENGDYEILPNNDALYKNALLGVEIPTKDQSKNYNANAFLEAKPAFLKGLSYKISGSYNFNPELGSIYISKKLGDLNGGSARVQNSQNKFWLIENLLNYSKVFDKHNVNLTALYSAQSSETVSSDINANTFINDNLTYYSVQNATNVTVSSGYNKSSQVSGMLRLNYAYDSRYSLTATVRRDGYSGFGENNKYGTFPSVAAAWNLDRETFLQNVSWVNNLKLRASYGISGNQAVGAYSTLTNLGTVKYIFDNVEAVGLVPSSLGNKDLRWESTRGVNLGLDFGLFANRLTGSVEAYKLNTFDLLLRRQLLDISGYNNILSNIGKTENKGFELTLNSRNIDKQDFTWTSNFNISINRNKLLELYGDGKDDIGNRWFIGKPLGGIYNYTILGIWQQDELTSIANSPQPNAKPGDYKLAALNGDSIVTPNSRSYLGTTLPRYIAGFTNTFNYKQFGLNIFLQAVNSKAVNPFLGGLNSRTNGAAELTYWTPENKSSTEPGLFESNILGASRYVSNSFVRLKNVTLSYSLPQSFLNKSKIKNFVVYATGTNLATFTSWVGWDPESDDTNSPASSIGAGSFDSKNEYYPLVASVIFGIKLSF